MKAQVGDLVFVKGWPECYRIAMVVGRSGFLYVCEPIYDSEVGEYIEEDGFEKLGQAEIDLYKLLYEE